MWKLVLCNLIKVYNLRFIMKKNIIRISSKIFNGFLTVGLSFEL